MGTSSSMFTLWFSDASVSILKDSGVPSALAKMCSPLTDWHSLRGMAKYGQRVWVDSMREIIGSTDACR